MVNTRTPEGGGWPSFLSHRARVWFDQAGWTSSEWNILYGTITHLGNPNPPGRQGLREWLREPPSVQLAVISPAAVMDAFGAYGTLTPEALNAYAAGASARFVAAFLAAHPSGNPEYAWALLHDELGLPENEATGWAMTRYLPADQGRMPGPPVLEPNITKWTNRFGPSSYLWVLAGYDLNEAITASASAPVSEQQLRVMVALAGIVLPAGV